MSKTKILIAGFFILIILLMIFLKRRDIIHKDLPLSFWLWHSNVSLDDNDNKILRSLKVKELFIRSGEFEYENEKIKFRNDQKKINIKFLQKFKITLVYTFSSKAKKNYSILSLKKYRTNILNEIEKNLELYKKKGLEIKGIQIDFDGPVSKVKQYSEVLHDLNNKYKNNYTLSAAVLYSWIQNPYFLSLIRNVDYYVPMLYFYEYHDHLDNFRPLTDMDQFENMVKSFKMIGGNYYIGLPSFGNCYIYSPDGELKFMDGQIELDYLSENINVVLKDIKKYKTGNDIYEIFYHFTLIDPVYFKNYYLPKDWQIIFNFITSSGIRSFYNYSMKNNDSSLKGVIFFRYPKKYDNLVLSKEVFQDLLNKRDTKMAYSVNIKIVEDTKEYIDIKIVLRNNGYTGSIMDNRDQFIQFRVPGCGFEILDKGDFDQMIYGTGKNRDIRPSSVKRANLIRLYEYYLDKDEKTESGIIRINKNNFNGYYYMYHNFYSPCIDFMKPVIEKGYSFYE